MKHIELYGNHAQYENDSHAIPNVSYCIEQNEVHYNPTADPDPYRGHEYVEIGGTKWAKVNIGATDVIEAGLYFQWGDTHGYTVEEINAQQTPSCENGIVQYPEDISTENDAAVANWGGNWRMPTAEEIQTLIESTNVEYVYIIDENITIGGSTHLTQEEAGTGVYGFKLVDKNDPNKYLLFPRSGWQDRDGNLSAQEDTVVLSKTKSPEYYDGELNLSQPSSLWMWVFENEGTAEYNVADTPYWRRYPVRAVAY